MSASFHDDKVSLRDGLELIRGHKRPLNHLETLAAIVLSPGDGTAHHGAAAQGLGQHLRCLALRREAAEDGSGGLCAEPLWRGGAEGDG